jgi:hypothetical protein
MQAKSEVLAGCRRQQQPRSVSADYRLVGPDEMELLVHKSLDWSPSPILTNEQVV